MMRDVLWYWLYFQWFKEHLSHFHVRLSDHRLEYFQGVVCSKRNFKLALGVIRGFDRSLLHAYR